MSELSHLLLRHPKKIGLIMGTLAPQFWPIPIVTATVCDFLETSCCKFPQMIRNRGDTVSESLLQGWINSRSPLQLEHVESWGAREQAWSKPLFVDSLSALAFPCFSSSLQFIVFDLHGQRVGTVHSWDEGSLGLGFQLWAFRLFAQQINDMSDM